MPKVLAVHPLLLAPSKPARQWFFTLLVWLFLLLLLCTFLKFKKLLLEKRRRRNYILIMYAGCWFISIIKWFFIDANDGLDFALGVHVILHLSGYGWLLFVLVTTHILPWILASVLLSSIFYFNVSSLSCKPDYHFIVNYFVIILHWKKGIKLFK